MNVKRVRKIDTKTATILACDPSLNGTAYHAMRDGKVIQSWFFTEKKKEKGQVLAINGRNVLVIGVHSERRGYQRLKFNRDMYIKILDQVKPDYVAMEDYSLGSKGFVYDIGELGGVLRLSTIDHGIPLRLYEPTRVKKFGTGSGNAPKSQVVAKVLTQWEKIDYSVFGIKGEDLADAYVIGQLLTKELMLHDKPDLLQTLPAYQIDVFTGVSKAYTIPLLRRAFIRDEQDTQSI